MKAVFYPFILVLILTLSLGCGKNCTVSGRVTFSDGTPLTVGLVVFETDTSYASGAIDSNGYFKMGSSNLGDGVPRGTYKVSIQEVRGFIEEFVHGPDRPPVTTVLPSPIDTKFTNPATSGLTCEVKGRTKFDITVEPPQ